MVHAVRVMEDRGPGAAVAAEVAVAATSVAAATHHAVAEAPRSTPPGTAALALAPKPSPNCCCGALGLSFPSPVFGEAVQSVDFYAPPPSFFKSLVVVFSPPCVFLMTLVLLNAPSLLSSALTS